MPCTSEPSHDDAQKERVRLNLITRLACDRCHEIEKRGGVVPSWARDWWNEHQDSDLRRRLESEQAREQMQTRQRAIAKLTPEERAELGV